MKYFFIKKFMTKNAFPRHQKILNLILFKQIIILMVNSLIMHRFDVKTFRLKLTTNMVLFSIL